MPIYNLVRSAVKTAYGSVFYSPHWRIGWRFTDSADVLDRQDLSGPPWRSLRNPAHRFLADPFPMSWRGRICLFFEDFDHRTAKGRISALAFGPHGPEGEVFPVLE